MTTTQLVLLCTGVLVGSIVTHGLVAVYFFRAGFDMGRMRARG